MTITNEITRLEKKMEEFHMIFWRLVYIENGKPVKLEADADDIENLNIKYIDVRSELSVLKKHAIEVRNSIVESISKI